eukprot:1196272-Prorocentrum_minimum.AAC.1
MQHVPLPLLPLRFQGGGLPIPLLLGRQLGRQLDGLLIGLVVLRLLLLDLARLLARPRGVQPQRPPLPELEANLRTIRFRFLRF